jgi:hypothetical protein
MSEREIYEVIASLPQKVFRKSFIEGFTVSFAAFISIAKNILFSHLDFLARYWYTIKAIVSKAARRGSRY